MIAGSAAAPHAGGSARVNIFLIVVLRILLPVLIAAVPALAGEYAVLQNGSRIRADRHDRDGALVRLYTGSGTVELPASAVQGFEEDDYVPPPRAVQTSSEAPKARHNPQELLAEAADQAGLPRELVNSVARAESGFNPNAVSSKGALGLMQLMPGTAAALAADPKDPKQNATAGAMYLRELLEKYRNDDHQVSKAIAAYNAGPGAVNKYNGVPPYRETQTYVRRVIKNYSKQVAKKTQQSGAD